MASAQQPAHRSRDRPRVAEHVFVPFTVGGGIRVGRRHVRRAQGRRREDQHRLDGRPRARDHPRRARRRSAASASCLSTQVKRVAPESAVPSGYEVFIDGARVATGMDAIEWVKRGEELGAGEIVVNSIDNDGTAVRLRPRDHARGRRRGQRPGDRVGWRRDGGPHRRRAHDRRRLCGDHQLDPLLTPARPEHRGPGAQGRAWPTAASPCGRGWSRAAG